MPIPILASLLGFLGLLIVSVIVAVVAVVNNQKLKSSLREMEDELAISHTRQERLKDYYSQWVVALIANSENPGEPDAPQIKVKLGYDIERFQVRGFYATWIAGDRLEPWGTTAYSARSYEEALGNLFMALTIKRWAGIVVCEQRGSIWFAYLAGQKAKTLSETGVSEAEALGKFVMKNAVLLNLEVSLPVD